MKSIRWLICLIKKLYRQSLSRIWNRTQRNNLPSAGVKQTWNQPRVVSSSQKLCELFDRQWDNGHGWVVGVQIFTFPAFFFHHHEFFLAKLYYKNLEFLKMPRRKYLKFESFFNFYQRIFDANNTSYEIKQLKARK